MKSRTRTFAAALLLSTAPLAFVACDDKKPAASGTPAAGAASSNGAAPAGSAELSASAYGFAARLPASTEGFLAVYRAGDMVESFLGSNWFRKLTSNPAVAQQWEGVKAGIESDPQALAMVREIAGKEAVFVLGEGFTDNAGNLASAVIPIIRSSAMAGMQAGAKRVAEGADNPQARGPSFGEILNSMPAEQRARMFEALAEADFPPLLAAVKAGSVKDKIDAFLQQALSSLPPEADKVLEKAAFGVSGNKFQSLIFKVSKLPVPSDVAAAELQEFVAIFGDKEKAQQFLDKFKTKTVELSWGWVDDYLVLSLGKDHSHLKLSSPADSVISRPEVAARAAAWQAKQPLLLSYISKETNQAIADAFGGIGETLVSLAEMGAAQSPFPLDGIIADLKKLDARAKEIWPANQTASVAAAWWEGGLNIECFGGSKPRALDSSKPLTGSSLAGPATVLLYESRVNEAESDKTFAFIEEAAGVLFESYQKNIKPSIPQEQATGLVLAEGVGVGIVKELWKNFQQFRAAIGAESAVVVNLDGPMPPLPNVPEELKDMKFPRVVMVTDLKDPAKLSESWKGIGTAINGIIAMSGAPVKAAPVEKQEGPLTVWGYQLPMDLGDLWPHFGVAGQKWYAGTSPALTKEVAAKAPAPAGPASGMRLKMNMAAAWDWVDNVNRTNPDRNAAMQAAFADILVLLRSVHELDIRSGEDKGDAHHKVLLRVTDAK